MSCARVARLQGEERRPWFGASEFLCVAVGAHKQKASCRALSEGGGAGSLPQSTLAHWSVAMSAIAQCPEILVGILEIRHTGCLDFVSERHGDCANF
jgi:hypothetical protein